MIGEARAVYTGKRMVVADMEVKNEKGSLIAKGMATWAILGKPRPQDQNPPSYPPS